MIKKNISKVSSFLTMAATLLVGLSCDDTFSFLDASNFTRWSYSQTEGMYDNLNRDSVWIPKSRNSMRANTFTFFKNDVDKNDGGILLTFEKGEGTLAVDGTPIEAGRVMQLTNKTQFTLTFVAGVTSTADIIIHLQSALTSDAKGTPTVIRIHAFENRKPISKLAAVRQTAQANGLRYNFDASQSADLDIRWGDNLTIYNYTVVSSESKTHTFFVDKPKMDYLFPDYGTYKVTLAVRDANGGISTSVETTVNVIR